MDDIMIFRLDLGQDVTEWGQSTLGKDKLLPLSKLYGSHSNLTSGDSNNFGYHRDNGSLVSSCYTNKRSVDKIEIFQSIVFHSHIQSSSTQRDSSQSDKNFTLAITHSRLSERIVGLRRRGHHRGKIVRLDSRRFVCDYPGEKARKLFWAAETRDGRSVHFLVRQQVRFNSGVAVVAENRREDFSAAVAKQAARDSAGSNPVCDRCTFHQHSPPILFDKILEHATFCDDCSKIDCRKLLHYRSNPDCERDRSTKRYKYPHLQHQTRKRLHSASTPQLPIGIHAISSGIPAGQTQVHDRLCGSGRFRRRNDLSPSASGYPGSRALRRNGLSLDFGSELEIALVQILSVTVALFISTINHVLYRLSPLFCLIRSSDRPVVHGDEQNKA
ncbi:hypothetical protein J6590_014190 [Homalodisca vitripennis]|nr:hypothetical protein J6590_014190 [Homalodisca vitripennis]